MLAGSAAVAAKAEHTDLEQPSYTPPTAQPAQPASPPAEAEDDTMAYFASLANGE